MSHLLFYFRTNSTHLRFWDTSTQTYHSSLCHHGRVTYQHSWYVAHDIEILYFLEIRICKWILAPIELIGSPERCQPVHASVWAAHAATRTEKVTRINLNWEIPYNLLHESCFCHSRYSRAVVSVALPSFIYFNLNPMAFWSPLSDTTEKKNGNTYAYDGFFALAACFGVFLDVAFRADRVSFAFVECNGCNWFLTHETDEMFWMPWFPQSGQSLEREREKEIYI